MRHLITTKYFLVVTGLFLLLTTVLIWFFFPPLLNTLNENRSLTAELAGKIASSQAEATTVRELEAASASLNDLYDKASTALPTAPTADLLLLQLDGLTKNLGLTATITVPFSEGAPTTQLTTPPDANTVKPGSGSMGSVQPLITSSVTGTGTVFSLSGEWDYPSVLKILSKLKTFSRWNAVTSIDLTKTTDKMTATISGKVYWTPSSKSEFSGSVGSLLSQAKALFESSQIYAVAPDVTKEGNFGKSNPFLP